MEIKKDIQYMYENVGRSPGKLLESLKKLSKKQGREKTLNTAFGFLMNLFREKESMLFHSFLNETANFLSEEMGIQSSYNLLSRIECALKIKKPSFAIYDHTIHLIGGGQKYGLTVANILKDIFDVTIIANKKVTHQDFLEWYGLDLSECKIKIINLPFFEESDSAHLDPAKVTLRTENPFHSVSLESGNYDFFLNNSMNEMVYPLSNISLIICHFPERRPRSYFYSDLYTYVIYNSKYTAGWIEKKWKFTPHKHIYPPVDMEVSVEEKDKENIILSVARFEAGGSKKQLEMIRSFMRLNRRSEDVLRNWKLILVGGSHERNPYLDKIKNYVLQQRVENIKIKTNISEDELRSLYKRSKIFWHLCGLDHTDPALIEHFGMTIVESMQNKLVPIVYDGGGQQEIVEQGKSGFRVTTTSELINHTLKLIQNPELLKEASANSYERSKFFSIKQFEENVKQYFNKILQEYTTF